MTPLEAVERALAEIGNAPGEKLVAFVQRHFGFAIQPQFLPLYRATIQDKQRAVMVRLEARKLAEQTRGNRVDGPPAVRTLARQLMDQHGLHAWSFRFNRRMGTLGFCCYSTRTIELSAPFAARNPEAEIRDTILHEIAHALVGPGHGHDRVWKRKCIEIGARPQRCGQADMPAGKWQASCRGCGRCFHRYRRPKGMRGWFCTTCGRDKGKLAWKKTG